MTIEPSFYYVDNRRLLGKPITGAEMIELEYEEIPANWEGFPTMAEAVAHCDKLH
jgi:hypothetical protein